MEECVCDKKEKLIPQYGGCSIPYFACCVCGISLYSELGRVTVEGYPKFYPREEQNAETYAYEAKRVLSEGGEG